MRNARTSFWRERVNFGIPGLPQVLAGFFKLLNTEAKNKQEYECLTADSCGKVRVFTWSRL